MKPAAGRSRIVRRCSRTSRMKRRMRNGRSSSENVFGAAAITRTRVATWAGNAPTNDRDRSQKRATATAQLQDCRIEELQKVKEVKEKSSGPSLPTILQSCNPAISGLFDRI